MYPNLGKIKPGTSLFVPWHAFSSDDPSASVTISGLATSDIEVYKDASMTQRSSDSGYALVDTDGVDLDGHTGIHGVTIDLADNTDAGFWEAGSNYVVVIGPITVDAATVNFIGVRFSIGYDGALLDTTIATLSSQTSFTLEDGPADDNALNGCPVIVHDIASAVQVAMGYVLDYTGSTKTVTLAVDPGVFTMAAGDNISFFMPSNTMAVNGTAQTANDNGADINTILSRVTANVATEVKQDIIDTVADAIKAVTDLIPDSGAMSSIATLANQVTIAGYIDTEVASILGAVDTEVAAIKAVTDNLPDSGALSSLAQAAKLLAYIQLLARSDAAIETDRATELGEINNDEGSGGGDYSSQSESQEAIRDRGDAAWVTGGGGSISDIINIQPLIPKSIDLANTATYRFGLMLVNSLDDLPSTAEITPGTISIERKAIGGTSWSSVVSDAACSEIAGLIYYDEVFDSGTGYAEGDSIMVTFKSQKVTVAANDYEIIGATGRMFYTSIRQTMRGTDSASTLDEAGVRTAVGLASANLDTQLDAIPTAAEIQAEMEENGASILDTISDKLPTNKIMGSSDGADDDTTLNTIAADVVNIDGDAMRGTDNAATAAALGTHDGKLDTVDGNVDTIVAKLPAGTLPDTDDIGVVRDNTLGRVVCTPIMLIPSAGTNDYPVDFELDDMAGNPEAPDSTPTIAATDQDGNNMNSYLSSTTMSLVSQGRYTVNYQPDNAHANVAVRFSVTVTESSVPRTYRNWTKVQEDYEGKINSMYTALLSSTSELSGAPAHDASALDKLEFLFMALKNESVADNSGSPATLSIANNAGLPIASANVTEAADTSTKGKYS